MKEARHINFEPELWARVDAARGDVPRSRWLARAAEAALDGPAPAVEQPHRETVRKPADPAQTIADNLARTGPAFEKVAAARKASRSDPDVQPIPKGKAR
jgi:hypothetical protein